MRWRREAEAEVAEVEAEERGGGERQRWRREVEERGGGWKWRWRREEMEKVG